MDTRYRKKLVMLTGAEDITGFVNMEVHNGKMTLQYQAVGLEREAADVHGYLVSLA